MGRERDHFAAARLRLAEYTASGRFGWGRPLAATLLAGEMGLSPTPVREALAHLAGEGVIEREAGRGYFAPRPSSSDIAELYELHQMFVHSALGLTAAIIPACVAGADDGPVDELEPVFQRLVGQPGNTAMAREHRRIATLLRPIRRVEATVAPVPDGLRLQLLNIRSVTNAAELSKLIDEYHRDRIARSNDVYAAIRRSV